VKKEAFDIFINDLAAKMSYFRDISTYGGCAAACAAALESTRIIEDENLCENSRIMGDYLLGGLEELKRFPIVGDVRGMGLFAGIEMVKDKNTKEPVTEEFLGGIVADIATQGVLVGKTSRSLPGLNNTINLAPALIATKDQIDRIVDAIRRAIEKGSKSAS